MEDKNRLFKKLIEDLGRKRHLGRGRYLDERECEYFEEY